MFHLKISCLPLAIIAVVSAAPLEQEAAQQEKWTLVFEEDFEAPTNPLADWTRFGDTSNILIPGTADKGLLITTEGGLQQPAYAGAVNRLGGGIAPDEIVTANATWTMLDAPPADASLAIKIEFRDSNNTLISSKETLEKLDGRKANSWNNSTVSARVPANTTSTDLALVVVPAKEKGTIEVVVDEVSVTRSLPPRDMLAGAGGFEASDGNATGWTVHNNALAIDSPTDDRIFKSWGPFIEPYAGSIMEQTVPTRNIQAGTPIRIGVLAKTPAQDSIADTDNFPILKVECLGADGKALAHIEARPFDPGTGEVPVDKWIRSSTEVPAPQGTVALRYILGFIQPSTQAGSILFKNPQLTVGDDSTNLLKNPGLLTMGTTLPDWNTHGDIEVGEEHHRSGTAALKLGPGAIASTADALKDWKPGEILLLEGWTLASSAHENGDGTLVMEVVQRDSDGGAIDTKTRSINHTETDRWQSTGSGEEALKVEVMKNATEIEIFLRTPSGNGDIWVDDLVVNRADDNTSTLSTIPVRNPSFEGHRPDEARWDVADGAWSHNGELQYYAPDSIKVDQNRMFITAEKRRIGDRDYSSGHISTKGRHEQKYGKWEIRAKLPTSQGMWPAIWLLPVDGSWPPEIDIIELVGKEPDKVHHSFHWGPLRDGLLPWDLGQTSTSSHQSKDFDSTFHDFSVEWTPEGIVWLVDGKETHRYGSTAQEKRTLPNGPMYLIVNLAIGGFWPGPPGEATQWPSTMEIDHIKIWEYNGPDA